MSGARVLHSSRVALQMERLPVEAESELSAELDVLAQMVVRRMRQLAPKFRSLLVNSIVPQSPEPLVRDIGPAVAYAAEQEEGIRAGGKGLPRYADPAAADIIAWLRTKAFAGRAKPRRNSMAAVRADLELRDRYEGLAWHIRHRGIKARPYVKPALEQLEPVIRVRLQAAAERALQRGGSPA